MKPLLFILVCLILSMKSFADYVDDGSKQYYGAITYMSKDRLVLKQDCSGVERTFAWNENLIIYFSDRCKHPGWDMSRSPITAENPCAKKVLFKFFIKSRASVCYAEDFSIQSGVMTIVYAKGKGTARYSSKDLYKYVEWINYTPMCVSDIPDEFAVF